MRPVTITVVLSLLLVGACNMTTDPVPLQQVGTERMDLSSRHAVAAEPQAASRRYLAVRHALEVRTEPEEVESAWRRANEACEAAGCEVLSSALARDDDRLPANASLDARVPPEKLEAFLTQVSALGRVGRHTKTAEDKTDEVVDVEARLKNMAEFRDRLRTLLATPGAKLKDVMEVERELARVQGDLDSLTSRRKALASQTDMVRVALNFRATAAVLEPGMWTPVRDAVVGAGRLLSRSVAALISFVVAVLPWSLLMLLLAFVLRKAWRRRRAARPAVRSDALP